MYVYNVPPIAERDVLHLW